VLAGERVGDHRAAHRPTNESPDVTTLLGEYLLAGDDEFAYVHG
ncbi:MAG: hypothetical protein RL552_684, partial [Actinomycetota bacterium]